MNGPREEELRALFDEVRAPQSLDAAVDRKTAAHRRTATRPRRRLAPLWIGVAAVAVVVALVAVFVPRPHSDDPSDSSTTRPQRTPAPSPSASASPTPSMSPSPSASPPSSPSATPQTPPTPRTVGIPEGTSLRVHEGDLRVSQAGQVVSDVQVNGNVVVAAPNVTLRRVKVVATAEFAVQQPEGVTNLTIENSDISGRPGIRHGIAQDGTGLTLRDTVIHDIGLAVLVGPKATIERCRITDLTSAQSSYGVFSEGDDPDMVVRDTVIDNRNGGAAIALYTKYGGHSNVLVEGNTLAGGDYTLYAPDDKGRRIRVLGNRFTRAHHRKSGVYGPVTSWRGGNGNEWSNNTYDDGTPVTP